MTQTSEDPYLRRMFIRLCFYKGLTTFCTLLLGTSTFPRNTVRIREILSHRTFLEVFHHYDFDSGAITSRSVLLPPVFTILLKSVSLGTRISSTPSFFVRIRILGTPVISTLGI